MKSVLTYQEQILAKRQKTIKSKGWKNEVVAGNRNFEGISQKLRAEVTAEDLRGSGLGRSAEDLLAREKRQNFDPIPRG